jgi:uncharacterized membrane protein YdfJ with MMPL/SSD domain
LPVEGSFPLIFVNRPFFISLLLLRAGQIEAVGIQGSLATLIAALGLSVAQFPEKLSDSVVGALKKLYQHNLGCYLINDEWAE